MISSPPEPQQEYRGQPLPILSAYDNEELALFSASNSSDARLTNQSPMLVNSSRQGDLVLGLSTGRSGQSDLGQISLHTQNTTSDLRSTNIDEQLLSGSQFLYLWMESSEC
jgi:hypothetical protein